MSHPEGTCEVCGRPNRSWFVDSDRFNAAMHAIGLHRGAIVCPTCFMAAHVLAAGLTTSWQLVPATPFRPVPEEERPSLEGIRHDGSCADFVKAWGDTALDARRERDEAREQRNEAQDALSVIAGELQQARDALRVAARTLSHDLTAVHEDRHPGQGSIHACDTERCKATLGVVRMVREALEGTHV